MEWDLSLSGNGGSALTPMKPGIRITRWVFFYSHQFHFTQLIVREMATHPLFSVRPYLT